jgi:hypothetical protein
MVTKLGGARSCGGKHDRDGSKVINTEEAELGNIIEIAPHCHQ